MQPPMPANTGVHQFQLADRDGNHHQYIVMEHPAGEGMGIMYELMGLGAPAILGLAAAALKSEKVLAMVSAALAGGEDGEVTGADVADLVRLVSELDLGSVGTELGRVLATGRAPELTRQILSRTHRDGKPLSTTLDIAYQANYGELIAATWKVCQINRFFPGLSTSGSFSSAPAGTSTRPSSAPAG